MEWDLGPQGLATLAAMSVGFGAIAQLVMWRVRPHWAWAVGTLGYFVSGLFVSEVWFGWATEEDLQPNIDGLSFDEVLLIAPLGGILSLLAYWLLTRRGRAAHHPV
jgi:hypothetical protein